MSESAAKVTRRELRRAFGSETSAAIEQHDVEIRALHLNHNLSQQGRLALAQELTKRLDQHAALLQQFRNELASRTWRARLRKLFRR